MRTLIKIIAWAALIGSGVFLSKKFGALTSFVIFLHIASFYLIQSIEGMD